MFKWKGAWVELTVTHKITTIKRTENNNKKYRLDPGPRKQQEEFNWEMLKSLLYVHLFLSRLLILHMSIEIRT